MLIIIIIFIQLSQMTSLFRGLFKWSLQITGLSILCYHYQPLPNQHKIQAFYHFTTNSFHLFKSLYQIRNQINALKTPEFVVSNTQNFVELCKLNGGIYAKLAQFIAEYKQIVPSDHLQILEGINNHKPEEIPYTTIKEALAFILQKQMKDVFDGFQIKPLSCGWLTQSHKAILLQNYKQSVVKVLLPARLYQYQYEMQFINMLKPYVLQFLKNKGFAQSSINLYANLFDNTEKSIKQQLDLQKQVQNASKYRQLSQNPGSSFYVPYYYKTLSNRFATTKQFIQGIAVTNRKSLHEIGLTPELAYSYILSQVHKMIRKYQVINEYINQNNILIRKYVKKRTNDQTSNEGKPKKLQLNQIPYQVVFLNMNNFAEIKDNATNIFVHYWNEMKKKKSGLKLSVSDFHGFKQGKQSNRENYISDRLYLYEPLLRLFQKMVNIPLNK